VLEAGGAYVPVDPAYPDERLHYVVEDSAATVVVTERALGGRLPAGGPRRSYPAGRRLEGWFAEQAAATPDAVAVSCGAVRLTYGELARRSGLLAERLAALGVGPETRVALLLGRSVEMAVAILGVLEAGGAYVPVDPAYPDERLHYVVGDSAATVVVTERTLAGFQQAADDAEADQRGLWGPAPTATPTRTPTVEGEEPEQATPTMTTTPALTITPAVDTTAATATPAAAATLTATTVITAPVP
jgi:non-ribosomal peptide synthetase component F